MSPGPRFGKVERVAAEAMQRAPLGRVAAPGFDRDDANDHWS
jgi:hypothetical protein